MTKKSRVPKKPRKSNSLYKIKRVENKIDCLRRKNIAANETAKKYSVCIRLMNGTYKDIVDKIDVDMRKFFRNLHPLLTVYTQIITTYRREMRGIVARLQFENEEACRMAEKYTEHQDLLYKRIETDRTHSGLVQCGICYGSLKLFSRNCACKSDQHACITCVCRCIRDRIVGDSTRSCGVGQLSLQCPFCCTPMKSMKCPEEHRVGHTCAWCKSYKNINLFMRTHKVAFQ